jgi:hypothetical protein
LGTAVAGFFLIAAPEKLPTLLPMNISALKHF